MGTPTDAHKGDFRSPTLKERTDSEDGEEEEYSFETPEEDPQVLERREEGGSRTPETSACCHDPGGSWLTKAAPALFSGFSKPFVSECMPAVKVQKKSLATRWFWQLGGLGDLTWGGIMSPSGVDDEGAGGNTEHYGAWGCSVAESLPGALSEGSGLDLWVDGGSFLQHSLYVRSIERQAEVNAVQVSQPVGEDHGQSIADMLKALSVELKSGFETSNANQVEIRGLCEDLGKKIDDLAGRAAALEEEVGEIRVAVEENKEQIRYLKEGETGVLAKTESLENNLRRNNLRFLRVPEGLEEGDLKGFMARLIKQEVNVEISEEDIVKDIQRVHRFWQEVGDAIKEILPTSPKVCFRHDTYDCSCLEETKPPAELKNQCRGEQKAELGATGPLKQPETLMNRSHTAQ
ncbi:hypothetical protein NDU88_005859 [Pleurodeles waltl]|uniref:Uncharacterized protein n=1 Tax=Pleurodeles waltl TaxID=8319 RepID=A0AAV7NSM1_PLEWA|nr:hypothetical protein NDU88_005859 [Pleurodeles waltl]